MDYRGPLAGYTHAGRRIQDRRARLPDALAASAKIIMHLNAQMLVELQLSNPAPVNGTSPVANAPRPQVRTVKTSSEPEEIAAVILLAALAQSPSPLFSSGLRATFANSARPDLRKLLRSISATADHWKKGIRCLADLGILLAQEDPQAYMPANEVTRQLADLPFSPAEREFVQAQWLALQNQ